MGLSLYKPPIILLPQHPVPYPCAHGGLFTLASIAVALTIFGEHFHRYHHLRGIVVPFSKSFMVAIHLRTKRRPQKHFTAPLYRVFLSSGSFILPPHFASCFPEDHGHPYRTASTSLPQGQTEKCPAFQLLAQTDSEFAPEALYVCCIPPAK